MNGMLKKELLILKMGWKAYLALAVVFATVSFFGNPIYFSTMAVMYSMLLPLSSFSADEAARWDGFAAALPGGRRAVVKAKYQYLLMLVGGLLVAAEMVNLLIFLLGRGGDYNLPQLLVSSLVCGFIALLINCVFYPLMFRYGSQKARVALGVVVGLVAAGVVMVLTFTSLNNRIPVGGSHSVTGILAAVPAWVPPVVAVLALVVLAAALLISWRVSLRIYEKREF